MKDDFWPGALIGVFIGAFILSGIAVIMGSKSISKEQLTDTYIMVLGELSGEDRYGKEYKISAVTDFYRALSNKAQ